MTTNFTANFFKLNDQRHTNNDRLDQYESRGCRLCVTASLTSFTLAQLTKNQTCTVTKFTAINNVNTSKVNHIQCQYK